MARKEKSFKKETRKTKAVLKKERVQTEYQRTRDLEKRRRRKGHNGFPEEENE